MAQGSDSKLYIALGVLGVLGVGYFMQLENTKKVDSAHSLESAANELPTVSVTEEQTGSITKIVIEKPAEESGETKTPAVKHVLVKDGDTWKLEEPVAALANQKNVESLLKNLNKLQVKEQVGKNKESYEKFEVDDAHATHSAFYAGDKLVREIWAGKSGGRGQLARIDGTDAVLVLDGYSSFLYGRETKGWRDLKILELDTEEVSSIGIENEYGTYTFEKGEGDDEWSNKFKAVKAYAATKIDEFEASKMKQLLNAYKKLNATGFGDEETLESTGLNEPAAKLTIHLGEGKEQTILFGGNAEGSSRWAKLADDDQIYMVSSWASDWAFAEQDKFQKTPEGEAPAAPPGGMPPGMPGMPGMPPGGMPPGHP